MNVSLPKWTCVYYKSLPKHNVDQVEATNFTQIFSVAFIRFSGCTSLSNGWSSIGRKYTCERNITRPSLRIQWRLAKSSNTVWNTKKTRWSKNFIAIAWAQISQKETFIYHMTVFWTILDPLPHITVFCRFQPSNTL